MKLSLTKETSRAVASAPYIFNCSELFKGIKYGFQDAELDSDHALSPESWSRRFPRTIMFERLRVVDAELELAVPAEAFSELKSEKRRRLMRRYLPGGAFILFCCMVIGKVVSYYDNKQLDYAADKVQSVVALPAEEAEQGTGVEYSFFAFPTHVEVSDEFRRDWGDDSWIAQDFVDSYQRSTQSTLRTEQVAFIKTEIVPRLRTIAWICSEEGAKRPAQYEADFKQAIEYFGPTIYHSISAVGL